MKAGIAAVALVALLSAGAAWLVIGRDSDSADAPGVVRGEDARPSTSSTSATPGDPPAEPVRRAEPEAAARAPEAVPRRALHGRTIDARRRPLAGVSVALTVPGGGELAAAQSEASGAFALAPRAGRERAVLVARTADGRAAVKSWSLSSASDDLGVLVLDHASPLRVHATRGGSPAAGARLALDVGQLREPVAEMRADSSGIAVFDDVPDGFAWIRADVAGEALAGRARAFLPDVREIEVELAPAWGCEMKVVDEATREPIAGAEVSLAEHFGMPQQESFDGFRILGDAYTSREVPNGTFTSGADGCLRIGGLADDARFEVKVKAAGFRPASSGEFRAPAATAEVSPRILALERIPLRTVRVPVVAGELPIPARGTPLAIDFAPGGRSFDDERAPPGPLAMGAGEIVISQWDGDGNFVARTPDGSIAKLNVRQGKDVADATSFVKPRSIAVTVRDADGAPAAGARCLAVNQGNNALGATMVTSAGGKATLGGLPAELVNVMVAAPGEDGRGTQAGSVDLARGDAGFEFALPRMATLRLAIRIDGELALPSRFRVGTVFHRTTVLEEFPERGELRIGVALTAAEIGDSFRFSITSTAGNGSADVVPVVRGDEPVAEVVLRREAGLDVVVSRPHGMRVQIGLESYRESDHRFEATTAGSGRAISLPNGPGDTFRFRGLPPGTYRATDQQSKAVSQPVIVPEGGIAQVHFAVGPRKSVTGRVIMPEGTDLSDVRVVLEGDVADAMRSQPDGEFPNGGYVSADGTFDVAVPGDRDVVVRPWHPWLQPAAEGGRFATREGAAGVTLRLGSGQEVRVPLVRQIDGDMRVGCWRGAATGEPEQWLFAPQVEGALRFGGLEPGRYTFVVDPLRLFAPIEIRDVEVAEGMTVLEPASLVTGSTLRLRIQAPPGRDPPRVYAVAEHLDAPRYSRDVNSNATAEVTLKGLGAGRFRVRCGVIGAQSTHDLDREIVFDGATDVAVDVDLR